LKGKKGKEKEMAGGNKSGKHTSKNLCNPSVKVRETIQEHEKGKS